MITNNSDVSFSFSNIAVVNDATGSFSINNLETLLGAGEMAPGDSLSLSLTYQPKVLHGYGPILMLNPIMISRVVIMVRTIIPFCFIGTDPRISLK